MIKKKLFRTTRTVLSTLAIIVAITVPVFAQDATSTKTMAEAFQKAQSASIELNDNRSVTNPTPLFSTNTDTSETKGVYSASQQTLTMQNIIVFIRFKGQAEYMTSPISGSTALPSLNVEGTYNSMTGVADNTVMPSLRQYISTVSYGHIDVVSDCFPQSGTKSYISVELPEAETYYEPYSTTNTDGYSGALDRMNREDQLIREAVTAVKSEVESKVTASLDVHGSSTGGADGYIDSMTFVCNPVNNETWSTLLWPHKTSYYGNDGLSIGSSKVGDFNLIWAKDIIRDAYNPSVVIHEFMHTMGMPGLYSYKDMANMVPVSYYDVMSVNTFQRAQSLLQYNIRNYLGWAPSLSSVSTDQTGIKLTAAAYASDSEQTAIIIQDPDHSTNEFFVVEMKSPHNIDQELNTANGLLVYRVNTKNWEDNSGNAYAYSSTFNNGGYGLYVSRPEDTSASAAAGKYYYAALNPSDSTLRTSTGLPISQDTTEFNANALFYSDGTNSGIVIDNLVQSTDGKTMTFNITMPKRIDISLTGTTTATVANQTYTGSVLTFTPTVINNKNTLTLGTDYTVTDNTATDAGLHKMTITGINKYDGSITLYYYVLPCTTGITVADVSSQTYTGATLTFSPVVKFGTTVLVQGTDYTISDNTAKNAGSHTMTISGMGNFSGYSSTKDYTITPKIMTFTSISAPSQMYTGSTLTFTPYVSDGSMYLGYNVDYTLANNTAVNVGTYTLKIIGKGNYAGSTGTWKFTVAPATITFSIDTIDPQTYTGHELTFVPVVKDGTKILKEGTDYTVSDNKATDAGEYSLTVSGAGNYKGSYGIASYRVSKYNIKFLADTVPSKTYTGSALTFYPVVKDGTTVLTLGTDYTLSGNTATETGSYVMIITGIGKYANAGEEVKYYIEPLSGSFSIDTIHSQSYTGQTLTFVPVVRYNGKILTVNKDYVVSGNLAIDTANYTMTVSGIGNYAYCSGTAPYSIVDRAYLLTISQEVMEQTYTGNTLTFKPLNVTDGNYTLKEGTDYTVSKNQAINAGSYKMTITGIGSYAGTSGTAPYVVKSRVIQFSLEIPDKTIYYTGSAQTYYPVVEDGEKVLTLNKDYTLSGNVETNVGIYKTVKITGIGNYAGSTDTTGFQIMPRVITFTIPQPASKTYTGSAQTFSITVMDGTKTLTKGVDYNILGTLTQTDAGQYSVSAQGIGNYLGSYKSIYCVIDPTTVAFTVAPVAAKVFSGQTQTFYPTVTWNGRTLTINKDYTVTNNSNYVVGTYKMTVTGIGNFAGQKTTADYTISKMPGTISVSISNKYNQYTGSGISANLTVTYYGNTLTNGTDYTVTGSTNTNIGTYAVRVTGKGQYTGMTATADYTIEDGVAAFVRRLYNVCLDRDPDTAGFNDWCSQLRHGSITGSQAAYGFIFSKEFQGKNYCNDHYVEYLYKAFFDRHSDSAGFADWTNRMKNGLNREGVFNGFIGSDEFTNLCSRYGIVRGNGIDVPQYGTVPKGPCSIDGTLDGVTAFVTRLYNICLDRNPDADGLAHWTNQLWDHTNTGAGVAFGFIFSTEFIGKNYSNNNYLVRLYHAFFNRNADPQGYSNWIWQLHDGVSRDTVFYGFVGSDEFTNLCNSYGIVRG